MCGDLNGEISMHSLFRSECATYGQRKRARLLNAQCMVIFSMIHALWLLNNNNNKNCSCFELYELRVRLLCKVEECVKCKTNWPLLGFIYG